MNKAKIFTSGRSQAVRLPKEYRFKGREVMINKVGGMVILFPRGKGWELLREGIDQFTEDFLSRRDQPPAVDEREAV